MRRWMCFLLALSVALLGAAAALAEAPVPEEPAAGTADGFTWKALEDGTAEITGYTGPAAEVVIPAEAGGLPVSRIGAWAFEGCVSLTTVVIPESVAHIGCEAFRGCKSLKTIIAPERIKKALQTANEAVFRGTTFVITGDVRFLPNREDLKTFIEARGGSLTGSISGESNYLITNRPNSNTTKLKNARDLGIPIITEEEFLRMAECK